MTIRAARAFRHEGVTHVLSDVRFPQEEQVSTTGEVCKCIDNDIFVDCNVVIVITCNTVVSHRNFSLKLCQVHIGRRNIQEINDILSLEQSKQLLP